MRWRYAHPDDVESYPGWFELLGLSEILELSADVLMELEAATGYLVMDTSPDSERGFSAAIARREMRAMTATQWLAVRKAGVEVAWEDFRPHVMLMELEKRASGNRPGPQKRATKTTSRSKGTSATRTRAPRSEASSPNTTSS